MKKKLIALMLSAAMTAGMLAGCGSTSTTGSTDANAGPPTQERQKRKKNASADAGASTGRDGKADRCHHFPSAYQGYHGNEVGIRN